MNPVRARAVVKEGERESTNRGQSGDVEKDSVVDRLRGGSGSEMEPGSRRGLKESKECTVKSSQRPREVKESYKARTEEESERGEMAIPSRHKTAEARRQELTVDGKRCPRAIYVLR